MELLTPPSSQQYQKEVHKDTNCSFDDEIEVIKVERYPTPPLTDTNIKEPALKSRGKRKPKLRYRPPNGTILDIHSYDADIPIIEQDDDIDNEDVSFLHYALTYSKKTVVITGAGISVASGIPDFRSSNGLFQGLKSATSSGSNGKALFDSSVYSDGESTAKFHAMINQLYKMTMESEPTNFHEMMNDLSKNGRLLRHYTQNIDCIDSKLPHLQTTVPIKPHPPYPPTIQLHGTIKYMYCSKCRWNSEIQPDLFQGNEPPACPECTELDDIRRLMNKRSQGIGCLRPRIVLYNEFHPDGENIGNISATDLKSKPDCLIIAGTSLKIPGVRRLVKELAKAVHANKGCVIWINRDEPSMSTVDYIEHLDLIVMGDCQDIPSLVNNYDHQLTSTKGKRNSSKGQKMKAEETDMDKVTKKKVPRVSKAIKSTLVQSRLEELVTKINEVK